MEARIVCAANRFKDGLILVGARHWDMLMHRQMDAIGRDDREQPEQGFVDQFGAFYSRTEAWKIAEANGQIIRRCGGDTENGGTLYSENLY